MLKIKKRMRQAFALIFSLFFILLPLFQVPQAYAATCGDVVGGKLTYCSIGYHSDPTIDLPCPALSTCYQGPNQPAADCSWSVSAAGKPVFCWSYKDDGTGTADDLVNRTKLQFNCVNKGSLTDCGGILAQAVGNVLGSINQVIDVSTIPGKTPIGHGGGSAYSCVFMDYNQNSVKPFFQSQLLARCGQDVAGLVTTGVATLGAGFLIPVSAGMTTPIIVAAAGATVLQASSLKSCIAKFSGGDTSLLDWNGSVISPTTGATVCSTKTTLSMNVKDGITSNTPSVSPSPNANTFDLCNQIPDKTQQDACIACNEQNGGTPTTPKAIWTAVGCIPTTSEGIVSKVVKLALGLAGTAALLMILAGAFMLSTSQGDTKRVGEAKELITSAVIGLLFIIFSVTLLQFIGVSIFNIPGFGK